MSNYKYLIDAVTKSTKYMVSGARFGPRKAWGSMLVDIKPDKNYHIGVDYGTPKGTPLYAPFSGEVLFVQPIDKGTGYGRQVLVYVPIIDKTVHLAHLDKISVVKGQKLAKGELIGTSGNTGLSSGPHLHLGLASGRKDNLNKGTYGDNTWINPSIFYLDKVVEETKKTINEIAKEIWAGKGGWGVNPERAEKLKKAGYDPVAVQAEVNRINPNKKPVEKPSKPVKKPVEKPKPKDKYVKVGGLLTLYKRSTGSGKEDYYGKKYQTLKYRNMKVLAEANGRVQVSTEGIKKANGKPVFDRPSFWVEASKVKAV